MALVIVIAIVIGLLLLYQSYLHCAGSMCVFPLIYCDSKVVGNISEFFPKFLPHNFVCSFMLMSAACGIINDDDDDIKFPEQLQSRP